jgi:hypothetical protein
MVHFLRVDGDNRYLQIISVSIKGQMPFYFLPARILQFLTTFSKQVLPLTCCIRTNKMSVVQGVQHSVDKAFITDLTSLIIRSWTCISDFLGFLSIHMKSRDSSVGIALGYGPDDRGSRVRFPAVAGNFSLHHHIQNGPGPHPASYLMGTMGLFPGGKAAGA